MVKYFQLSANARLAQGFVLVLFSQTWKNIKQYRNEDTYDFFGRRMAVSDGV